MEEKVCAFNIISLPLAFVRSGWVNISADLEGQIRYVGVSGYYWSQVTRTSTNIYSLSMYSTSVEPSNFYARWHGFPLPASNIISLPLAFVRSGNVALYGGEVYAVGNNLYSGSRTARSASDVYYLGVAPTEVYLSGYLDRWYGFPLRWPSNIISLPLAFVRSGWVGIDGGTAHVVGQDGYRWSRVSSSVTGAYALNIYPTAVYPSYSNERRDGFPLRCLCMLERIWEYRLSMSRVCCSVGMDRVYGREMRKTLAL